MSIAVPADIWRKGHQAVAYVKGFRAGQLAAPGGTPLSPYIRASVTAAYVRGFEDGQRHRTEEESDDAGSGE